MKIVFCQATYKDDFELTKECIARVSPHVDATVIVYDQTMTDEQMAWLENWCDSGEERYKVYCEFKDVMADMNNAYLEKAKEIGADWVCASDPDELYSEELAVNLRDVIEQHNEQGYNLLPVHSRDQFENVEWLDELDLLKETPGGYRESSFWKPILIYKVCPDLKYEGVGVEKNVHMMLRTSVGWIPRNLPKELSYVHKKSAFQIWRNAARNFFIGGGGDNVGRINSLWEPLRVICARFKVRDWGDFQEFVKDGRGVGDEKFEKWLKDALQAVPTTWGTETRETAKWFFTFHPELVTDEIRSLIENPPKMTPEIEAENLITRLYFEVFGRHPDEAGKAFYVERILKGEMDSDAIVAALMTSEEYLLLSGKSRREIEQVKVKVPVNVTVNITEDTFVEALKRSGTYWERIKPKIDIGNHLIGTLKNAKRKEFLEWYYKNHTTMGAQDLVQWVLDNFPQANTIALCIGGYSEVLPMMLKSIKVMAPYVDEIHIQGDDFTGKDFKKIIKTEMKANSSKKRSIPVEIHIEPWEDNPSEYRNKLIAHVNNTEWILLLDHDEIPTEDLAENIRTVIEESQRGRRYNKIQLEVIDETIDSKGNLISKTGPRSGKDILMWNVDDPYYGIPHPWLKPYHYPWRTAQAPLVYRHVKEETTVLPRSARNVFWGGGGDNVREGNPLWIELRELAKDLGINTWARFDEYLKGGGIDPRLLDILVKLSEMPWKDDELGDPLRYYQRLQKKFGKK